MASVASTSADFASPQFWDGLYTRNKTYSRELNEGTRMALEAAATYFGDLSGKTVLDVGCGAGATSLFFAELGARVIAVDNSEIAIQALRNRCQSLGVTSVTPMVCDARAIDTLGPVDFVFGSMILHHIEPFGDFCDTLKRALKPGGKAFFNENNAASELLIWFRRNIVGKLWVPKYGDPYEFPLMPSEINLLRARFDVRIVYPKMVFFSLFALYILRNKMRAPFVALDRWLYRHRIGLKYSYEQYVYIAQRA